MELYELAASIDSESVHQKFLTVRLSHPLAPSSFFPRETLFLGQVLDVAEILESLQFQLRRPRYRSNYRGFEAERNALGHKKVEHDL